jgi:hypothetical protein
MESPVVRNVSVTEEELRPATDCPAEVERNALGKVLALGRLAILCPHVDQTFTARNEVHEGSDGGVEERLGVPRVEVGHVAQALLLEQSGVVRLFAIHHCLHLSHLLVAGDVGLLHAEPE